MRDPPNTRRIYDFLTFLYCTLAKYGVESQSCPLIQVDTLIGRQYHHTGLGVAPRCVRPTVLRTWRARPNGKAVDLKSTVPRDLGVRIPRPPPVFAKQGSMSLVLKQGYDWLRQTSKRLRVVNVITPSCFSPPSRGRRGRSGYAGLWSFITLLFLLRRLLSCLTVLGEVAELDEGSRLLSGCGGNTSPWVRIPASPPVFPQFYGVWLTFWGLGTVLDI